MKMNRFRSVKPYERVKIRKPFMFGPHYWYVTIVETDRKKYGKKYDLKYRRGKPGYYTYGFCNYEDILKRFPRKSKKGTKKKKKTDKPPIDIKEFLRTAPDIEHKNGVYACSNCNNGEVYTAGSPSLRKYNLEDFFDLSMMSGFKYFILVPKKMRIGNIKLSRRDKVDMCPRCRKGRTIPLTKRDGFNMFSHPSLLKRGYIAVITVR
jgi:hypothetical protein